MTSITRDLRKDLEKTVKRARRVAEAGARQAVQQLSVGDGDAPKDLTADQRALRTRLRAHGRQLGDRRDAKAGTQETARLVQECAYEHWHRMLFARFLAETDLLIEPESGVAITLDEVQELAREKATDWLELASEYAERMLPQIFRKDDPVLQIALPPETRSELEDLLKGLSKPVFEADDSLGWVYQFWQADKKDEVNKSETKIGADELPAVTQLFTEDYMVLFLLHNTLGAWWAGKVLAANPNLATSAPDEAALRAACKVGGIDWRYLRFVRDESGAGSEGTWRPAAGPFEGWPKAAKDLTVLDPCMGSGHFLVFALPMLVAFRTSEEGVSQSAAVDAVLKDNLFGLEIDPRCTQIAAFNLAYHAWRMVGYRPLPRLNLACSGLAIGVTKPEWLKLAERAAEIADPGAKRDIFGLEQNLITSGISARARNGLELLYDLFAKAPWLGSLVDPRRVRGDIFNADFAELQPLLGPIFSTVAKDEIAEMAIAAQGMAAAADLLGRHYVLVATNVPFLGMSKQADIISKYIAEYYANGKKDLSIAFCMRLANLASESGCVAFVSPSEWTYQRGYREFRAHALKSYQFLMLGALGRNAFDYGVRASPILSIFRNSTIPGDAAVIDVNDLSLSQKLSGLIEGPVALINSIEWAEASDQRILVNTGSDSPTEGVLGDFAEARAGSYVGDAEQFEKFFWEAHEFGSTFKFLQSSVSKTTNFGGRERVILWEDEKGRMSRLVNRVKHLNHAAQNWRRGKPSWGRVGIALSLMGNLPSTIYTGEIYDKDCCAIVPKDEADLPALTRLFMSGHFSQEIRKLDRSLKVDSPKTLLGIQCDLEYWREKANEEQIDFLAVPPVSPPNQWIFSGHPRESTEPLSTAVARLLGYRWPRQLGSSFVGCPPITGDGLETHSDHDGIVCLAALKGMPPAEHRLSALLSDAFANEWSAAKLDSLLATVGFAGKTLDDWLRDGFFQQHCEMFHQSPFIWHIWDGRRDGFHALVNYHSLTASGSEGRRTLEKVIYSYLGDWIDGQRDEQRKGVEGADGRLAAAEQLRLELTKILDGAPPYDIFVRWKALHEQPIGWEPDINDGVRMNIRPFMTARPLGVRGANACILRSTPKNTNWEKDRGKEPDCAKLDYPWFWGWDGLGQDFQGSEDFDGNRWNDLHYSRAVKQAARDRHCASTGSKI
jgi:hypothetical protein